MWLIILFCLALGLVIGYVVPVMVPLLYMNYLSIAILAGLDSIFGGIRAYMEDSFDNTVFITGFFANTLLAVGLSYLGDQITLELYLIPIVVFGIRIFQNLSIIRRYLLKK